MINCLISEMKKYATKTVDYDKLNEVMQEKNENPYCFQERLRDSEKENAKDHLF